MFRKRAKKVNSSQEIEIRHADCTARTRCVLLIATMAFGLFGLFVQGAYAEVPSIRPVRNGETPFVQVEEFPVGATSVSAEVYLLVRDTLNPRETTVVLEYVDEADYRPGSSEPYIAGTTVTVGTTSGTQPELHAHIVLQANRIYHYRIVASNSDGSFETPDQTVQTDPPALGGLPDGRVYEQISPVDKNNLDALGKGESMTMQASPSDAIPAFAYFSFAPFPVATGTSGLFTDYLSARTSSPAVWSTQGVQAPIEPEGRGQNNNEISGFTEDLARAIVEVKGPVEVSEPPVGPPGVINAYVRNNVTGSYELLAPDVQAVRLLFVDATRDDTHILFETEQKLLPAATAGVTNLYEWDESKPGPQRLSLAGVLPEAECLAVSEPPGCAPPEGSGAGPGGGEHQGTEKQDYLQNTISEDGSKIFFTARPSGRIYEREPQVEVTVPVSLGEAMFLAATPSGKYVFYTEGEELYRFDTVTEVSQALTSGAKGVLGSLGVSNDGAYVYFVAHGVLAANTNGNEGEVAVEGAPNLYVWHEDPTTQVSTITFIARLSTEAGGDEYDWLAANNDVGTGEEGKTSRLNSTGTALLFMSRKSLTGYDNGQPRSSACSTGNGEQIPCQELYLYDANESLSAINPTCVSCNPSGVEADAPARLDDGEAEVALAGPTWSSHLTRNLSEDGDRVFFETAESLVSQDTNGVGDVYEWEREGVGSCPSGTGHCLYLISTGTAHAKSFFGDASASGDNVFFFTRQPLVAQDEDLNFDVYDARVGGVPPSSPDGVPCDGEECQQPPSPTPVVGSPASLALGGVGNISPASPPNKPKGTKCSKGQTLSHGKCIGTKKQCAHDRRRSHDKCVKGKPKKRAGNKRPVKLRRGGGR